jgi:transposase
VSEIQGVPNCPGCVALRKRVEELEALVARLQEQIVELTNRLNQNSNNSSRPPSTDPPWKKNNSPKPKSSRAPGGQPGHPGHYRELLPPERVTKTVAHVPHSCANCGHPLPQKRQLDDPEPTRHQVLELPELPVGVTQHEGEARTCPKCGYVTRAEIPAEIRAYTLGPRLTAILSFLTGYCHLSKRQVQEVCGVIYGVPVGLGSIPKHEQEVATALAPAYQAVGDAVRAATVKNVDETGWNKGGVLCWLWVVATVSATFYQIQKSRGRKACQKLLGAAKNIIITDRWVAYARWPLHLRQICWAHLRRDFQRLSELTGTCRLLGLAGKRTHKRLFSVWQDFKAGVIGRRELQARMRPLRAKLERALQRGRDSPDKKAARFCRRLLKVYPALWTFVDVEGVEPTNNHAERMGRPAVLWRKCSFGNQSAEGCHFSEVILTVIQTLRMQKKPVLDYLTHAVAASRAQQPIPNIL